MRLTKIPIYLLMAMGVLIAGFGYFGLMDGNIIRTLGLPVGVSLLFFAYRFSKRQSLNLQQMRANEIRERTIELTATPWSSHKELKVKGFIGILIFGSIFVIPGVLILVTGLAMGSSGWKLILGGFAAVVYAGPSLIRGFMLATKPVLELREEGAFSPTYGLLKWTDIRDLEFQKFDTGGAQKYVLKFLLNKSKNIVNQVHWTERVLTMLGFGSVKNNTIAIELRDTNEYPETVYFTARYLWNQVRELRRVQ